ncbi:NAD(P)Hquinone oxidoreductase [Nymphaea thermarum]|nr:NAD(P)Hquinone oxidoreductase [Nymphaea thermarum]
MVDIEYIDVQPLHFSNTNLEVGKKFPPVVESFRKKIHVADNIFFASPEYNYSVTGCKRGFTSEGKTL